MIHHKKVIVAMHFIKLQASKKHVCTNVAITEKTTIKLPPPHTRDEKPFTKFFSIIKCIGKITYIGKITKINIEYAFNKINKLLREIFVCYYLG